MSNNNTTSVPAAEPTLVITNERTLNRMMAERAILLQRAAKASADMKALQPRLEAARVEAVQAVAAHDTLQKQYDQLLAEVLGNESEAKDLQALVSAGAKAMNWPVPPDVDEPAMQETGSFEAVQPGVCRDGDHVGSPQCQCGKYKVQPGDATQVIPAVEAVLCRHCKRAIARLPHADWHHTDNGFIACYPDAVVSTEAEPQPADAATEVIDRVTTTPAQDGGQG